jgi:hypothetical protein
LEDRRLDIVERELGIKRRQFNIASSQRGEQLDINRRTATVGERQVGVAEGSLAISEQASINQQVLLKPELLAARLKTQLLQTRWDEAKRDADVEKASPGTSTEKRDEFKALNRAMKQNRPIVEEYLFAEEIAKTSQAQLRGTQAENFAMQQQMKMLQLQAGFEKQKMGELMSSVSGMLKSGANAVDGADAINAIATGNVGSYTEVFNRMQADIDKRTTTDRQQSRAGKYVDPADFTQKERAQFDPASLNQYEDSYRNTGTGIETRTVKRPDDAKRWYWTDQPYLTLTRNRAVDLGVSKEWDEVGAVKQQGPETNTPSSNSGVKSAGPGAGAGAAIRSRVNEKAKTVKPAGTKKPASTSKTGDKAPSSKDVKLGDRRVTVEKDGKRFTVPMKQLQQALDAGYTKVKK